MVNLARIVLAVLLVFALCSATFAAEYWVIKGKGNKLTIVKQKPADASVIVKGPFTERKEAEVIITQSGPAVVEYWVIRERPGKCVIVERKPTDASIIFKGPFRARKEARVYIKECRGSRAAVVEYWVIREPSGVLVIVEERPSDPAVIVKGPFRDRKKAEVIVKETPRGGRAEPKRGPAEQRKVGPDRPKTEQAVPGPGSAPATERALPGPGPAPAPGASTPGAPTPPGGGPKVKDKDK